MHSSKLGSRPPKKRSRGPLKNAAAQPQDIRGPKCRPVSAIQSEIDELWLTYHADAQRPVKARSEFHGLRERLWSENEAKSTELLQPWLAMLEFGLEWLAYVHLALNADDEIGPKKPNFRVPWALIGSASSFGWSLRHACVLGFDTPARALLRTYVESLFLCLACLYDKSLAQAYQAADSDQKVVNFWHTLASPRNLHRRIIEIEQSLGLEADVIADLTEWRRAEYEVLSQSAHLSYLAAVMTCLPVSIDDDEVHRVGIFGRATANSQRPLSYAARTTWYFCRLSYGKLVGRSPEDDCLLVADKEDENHRSMVIGWEVLSTITRRHWNDQAL